MKNKILFSIKLLLLSLWATDLHAAQTQAELEVSIKTGRRRRGNSDYKKCVLLVSETMLKATNKSNGNVIFDTPNISRFRVAHDTQYYGEIRTQKPDIFTIQFTNKADQENFKKALNRYTGKSSGNDDNPSKGSKVKNYIQQHPVKVSSAGAGIVFASVMGAYAIPKAIKRKKKTLRGRR